MATAIGHAVTPALLAAVSAELFHLPSSSLAVLSILRTGSLPTVFGWLKKEDRAGTDFSRTIDLARQRASANEHAVALIGRLDSLRPLLQPMYRGSVQGLPQLSAHLEAVIGRDDTEADAEPLALTDLRAVAEQWVAVETYFRERTDDASAEEILQFAETFVASGKFFSSLAGHAGGAALSFRYVQGTGAVAVERPLDSQLLQEHVQAAMLSVSRYRAGITP